MNRNMIALMNEGEFGEIPIDEINSYDMADIKNWEKLTKLIMTIKHFNDDNKVIEYLANMKDEIVVATKFSLRTQIHAFNCIDEHNEHIDKNGLIYTHDGKEYKSYTNTEFEYVNLANCAKISNECLDCCNRENAIRFRNKLKTYSDTVNVIIEKYNFLSCREKYNSTENSTNDEKKENDNEEYYDESISDELFLAKIEEINSFNITSEEFYDELLESVFSVAIVGNSSDIVKYLKLLTIEQLIATSLVVERLIPENHAEHEVDFEAAKIIISVNAKNIIYAYIIKKVYTMEMIDKIISNCEKNMEIIENESV